MKADLTPIHLTPIHSIHWTPQEGGLGPLRLLRLPRAKRRA